MNLTRLALANLRANPLATLLNLSLLALGTASIVVLLLVSEQFRAALARDARGIDLVIGAKGSPLQLILSSVYHADVPTGNIDEAEARRWAQDARVRVAVPLALGDSYRGRRIVGTTPEYLVLYPAALADGRIWQRPMEAVVGAAAARESGLRVGSGFAGVHGLSDGGHAHAARPYRVVGVLAPTGSVVDRLILTSLDSVWQIHGDAGDGQREAPEASSGATADHRDDHDHDHDHDAVTDAAPAQASTAGSDPRQITAMLLRYATPLAATSLPQQINASSPLQAAAPAFELARLLQLVGIGLDGLRAFAAVLILTAALSLFATLYAAMQQRRYDLAMMRCLGATRVELMYCLLAEGLLLSLGGAVLGLGLAHGVVHALGQWLVPASGLALSGARWLSQETVLLGGLLAMGVLVSALPAWRAYRVDVARTMAEG